MPHNDTKVCVASFTACSLRAFAFAGLVAVLIPLTGTEADAQWGRGFGGGGFGNYGGGYGGGGVMRRSQPRFGGAGRVGRPATMGSPMSGPSRAGMQPGMRDNASPQVGNRVPGGRMQGNYPRPGSTRVTHVPPQSGGMGNCRRGACNPPGRPGYDPPPPRRPSRPPVIVGVPPIVPPFVPPILPPEAVLPVDPPPSGTQVYDPAPRGPGGGAGAPPPPRRQNAAAPPPPPPSGSSGWNRSAGIPASGERRFVPDQIVCVLREGLSDAEITRFLRQHRMERTRDGRKQIALIGTQLFRYRITDRRDVPAVITSLQRDPRVLFAQPDFFYELTQDNSGAAPASTTAASQNSPPQYAVDKLDVRRAHELARGDKVLVAVIDSAIDVTHPEFAGRIAKQIDVTGSSDRMPHAHGTAMAGAIVSRLVLTGVAPAAEVIAIRAFAPKSSGSASGTSFALTQALDQAVAAGARVINLSFAGPPDPMLQRALKAAHDRGVVLVASMGNSPRAGLLYPAADPNVIAVTATDASDRLYADATRGAHVAVAAPGVDVIVPAPRGEYGLSTGTSVAAAHVSGVVALLLARRPALDTKAVREVLRTSARPASPDEAPGALGAGVASAYGAVVAVEPTAVSAPAPQSSVAPALATQ